MDAPGLVDAYHQQQHIGQSVAMILTIRGDQLRQALAPDTIQDRVGQHGKFPRSGFVSQQNHKTRTRAVQLFPTLSPKKAKVQYKVKPTVVRQKEYALMSDKTYIKMLDIEPEYGGRGWVYIEFDGEWATRQIGVYPDRVLLSTKDNFITDLPLDESELDIPEGAAISQITQEEFVEIWKKHTSET
jgi:hypothetical protein